MKTKLNDDVNIDDINLSVEDLPNYFKQTNKLYYFNEVESIKTSIKNVIDTIDFEEEINYVTDKVKLEQEVNVIYREIIKAVSKITQFMIYYNNQHSLGMELHCLMTKEIWAKLVPIANHRRAIIKRILVDYKILEEVSGENIMYNIIKGKPNNANEGNDFIDYAKSFRIHPKHLTSIIEEQQLQTISYEKKVAKQYYENKFCLEQIIYTKQVLNELTGEELSVQEIAEIARKRANEVKIVKYEDIKSKTIKHKHINGKYISTSALFNRANKWEHKVIFWNNEYFTTGNFEAWKINKAENLLEIYHQAYFDIINNSNIRASVNDTNNRLDHNLTNLKSDLIKYFKLDDENLCESDVANMQPALLVLFAKYNDVILDQDYIKWSTEGIIYDKVAELLEISRGEEISRDEVKQKFMVAFFSKQEDEDLKELFPLTMQFLTEFKVDKSNDVLPNELSKLESKIMIRNVLPRLINEGIRCLTKHDSILHKISDSEDVQQIMYETFRDMNFDCSIRSKVLE